MLQHAHDIVPFRKTEEVNFTVSVSGWTIFATLRTALFDSCHFSARSEKAIHKLRHKASGHDAWRASVTYPSGVNGRSGEATLLE